MKVIEWVKASWKDPVGSKIIAAVIIGSALSIWLIFKHIVSEVFKYLITQKVTVNLLTLLIVAISISVLFYYLLRLSKTKKKTKIMHSSIDPVKVEMDKIKVEHQYEVEQKVLAAIQPLRDDPDKVWKVFMEYGIAGKDLQEFLYKYKDQIDSNLYKKIAIRIAN